MAVFTKVPGEFDAVTGPITQVVAAPTASGSVNTQDDVTTAGLTSVTLMEESDTLPVFTKVNL